MAGHALPYDPVALSTTEEPATKKLKSLACLRCRRRKQKCGDQRPCANCMRSGEECLEVAPKFPSPSPVAGLAQVSGAPVLQEISVLDSRLSRIEGLLAASCDSISQQRQQQQQQQQQHRRSIPSSTETANDHDTYSAAHANSQLLDVTTSNDAAFARGSAAAIGLLATFGRFDESMPSRPSPHGPSDQAAVPSLCRDTEHALFDTYYHRIHCRYPFLRLDHLRDAGARSESPWAGFFTNMIFSIGLLVGKSSHFHLSADSHAAFYRLAVTRYLSHVFAQHDRLLHIQAYLLLAMHALYSPSTERIMAIASATMRMSVSAQLHLAEAEPIPADYHAKILIQMRRRIFWSSYALDRAVGTMFDLPFSVPDYQINVKMYANIDDAHLDNKCELAFPDDPSSQPSLTGVSAALHVVYCRQIQSEILNTTLHRDFASQFEHLSNWRLRILEKLDRWKSLCHRYSDSHSRSFTSSEWLHMIYNYSLAMLYRPTKASVQGPAGDWTVKSCIQACLIFRKFQKGNAISEAWMALIAQFKCGVALLYCYFATPPGARSSAYDSSDAAEAVRACSITLSLLAERWPQSTCLRDCFDILAQEIPLSEPPIRRSRGIAQASSDALMSLLSQLEPIIVHRATLRMINEIATEHFPRATESGTAQDPEQPEEVHTGGAENDADSAMTAITGDIFQPMTPHFFWPEGSGSLANGDNFGYEALGFPGIFDPSLAF